MKTRVFVVHGWQSSPEDGWFPWLKGEILKAGLEPHILEMPNPLSPQIDSWVHTLSAAVHEPDPHTFFIGHSIGCQTILRYLEKIPDEIKVGGVIMVAGWLTLKPAAIEDESDQAVADPWLHRPLNWAKIKTHVQKVVSIASDDDPLVPLEDQHMFKMHLGAEVMVEHQRRHFSGSDGVLQLPSVLKALQHMTTSTTKS